MIPEWVTPWPFLIAGIAVYLLISHLRAKKRTRLLKQAVTRLGLKFHEGSDLDDFIDGRFKFFKQGNTRMVANLITGRWENLDLKIADYDYSTGHGRHSKHYEQTVAMVTIRNIRQPLPHFFLRPQKSIYDAFGKVFGGQDIDFEQDRAFSRAFVLQGRNEEKTRQFFSTMHRTGFVKLHKHKIVCEGDGDTFMVHFGKYAPAIGLLKFLQKIGEVRNLLT